MVPSGDSCFTDQVTWAADEREVINRKFTELLEVIPMSQNDQKIRTKALGRRQQTTLSPAMEGTSAWPRRVDRPNRGQRHLQTITRFDNEGNHTN